MSEPYKYRGQTITVRAKQKRTESPIIWVPEIFITGALYILHAFDKYPPKHFPTSEAAIKYGKEAAEYLIDHPPGKKIEIP
jgi:hypothetical protein